MAQQRFSVELSLRKNLLAHFKRKHPNSRLCTKETGQRTIDTFYKSAEVVSNEMEQSAESPPGSCDSNPENPLHETIFSLLNQLKTSFGHEGLVKKIDRVIELLELLLSKSSQTIAGDVDNSNNDYGPVSIRSVQGLMKQYDSILETDEENNMLYCSLCKNKGSGTFIYDFKEGLSFERGTVMPKKFCNLKTNVMRHFSSRNHLKEVHSSEVTFQSTNKVLVRTAYHTLLDSSGKEDFPKLIALQRKNGLSVGNTNHSKNFVPKVRKAMYDVMTEAVSKFLQQTPCFSWVADKYTTHKKAFDIIAVHVICPEAEPGSLVQSLVIGSVKTEKTDCDSLMEGWLECATRMNLIPAKLVSICTDGEYLRKSVPQKFIRKIQERPTEELSTHVVWDPAHLLELSGKKLKELDWISDVTDIVQAVTNHFRSPDALAKANLCFGGNMKAPVVFSDTRWFQHASNALEVFIKNSEAYYSVLHSQKKGETTTRLLVGFTGGLMLSQRRA